MIDFFHYMFSGQPWYTGAIWANMLQGLLFLVPSVMVILRKLEKHHQAHMAKLHEIHKSVINQ